jgi:hypothetical protein
MSNRYQSAKSFSGQIDHGSRHFSLLLRRCDACRSARRILALQLCSARQSLGVLAVKTVLPLG